MTRRKRMLVISSYGIPCGIAQYAERVVPMLEELYGDSYDVEVAPLDVTILKARTRTASRLAATLMREIERKARAADVVNIQLEPGLYGFSPFTIQRRLARIFRASKRVILVHHTVLSLKDTYLRIPSGFRDFVEMTKAFRRTSVLRWVYRTAVRNPRKFFHIVQTRADARAFALLGMPAEAIASRPLAFLPKRERLARGGTDEQARMELLGLDGSVRLIGVFGFLTAYKGIEVAMQAMDHLPKDHHLVIVGGLHPETISQHTTEQPYLSALLKTLMPDPAVSSTRMQLERLAAKRARIHFVGRVNDDAFADYMRVCDAVVLPYAEVGQKSSGPASLALDLGKRLVCSRTICFTQLDAYEPGIVDFFEIGNHLELAQRIIEPDRRAAHRAAFSETYNVEARAALYDEAARYLLAAVR